MKSIEFNLKRFDGLSSPFMENISGIKKAPLRGLAMAGIVGNKKNRNGPLSKIGFLFSTIEPNHTAEPGQS